MPLQVTSPEFRKASRKTLKRRLPEIILGLVALAGYLLYLNQQDARVKAHFDQSRKDSPETYLEEIRIVQGFDAYLDAYSDIYGSGRFTEEAPGFLLGRWALFDHPLRVDDRFSTAACRNSALVENGRLTLPGAAAAMPAEYWLSGDRVIVRLHNGDEIFVRLKSSGINLNHLEFDRGHGSEIGYAYRCT